MVTQLTPIVVQPPIPEGYLLAYPQVDVTIYCNEGPILHFDSNSSTLLSVETTKSLHNPAGVFSLELAPSGPLSVKSSSASSTPASQATSLVETAQAFPDYTNVITQNSLVIIRMRRTPSGGPHQAAAPSDYPYNAATVMVGVVTKTTSTLQYEEDSVTHVLTVSGMDFAYYLTRESYYTLTSLGLILGSGQELGLYSPVEITPKAAGEKWFTTVMFGENGFLSQVAFNPIKNGSVQNIPLSSLFYYTFLDYGPANGANIPTQLTLTMSDGMWWTKFENLFLPPMYEFFVNTAPLGFYPNMSLPSGNASSGILNSPRYPEAVPVLVARTNPNPFVYYDVPSGQWLLNNTAFSLALSNSGQNPPLGNVDYQGVHFYDLSKETIFQSNIQYTQAGIKNFFLYQPYLFSFNTGLQTTLLKNLFIDFGTIIDFRSLLKYGYAPMTIQSFWFSDLTGNGAKLNQGVLTKDQLQALYITSVSQVASYYTSLPNLLSGTVTMPLAPNVLIGNFALLDPWKTGTPYNGPQGAIFYITGVSHRWRMGGKSQTSLQIERGLPAHVYLDDNALKEFLLGNSTRVNGIFAPKVVPPATGNTPTNFENFPGLSYVSPDNFYNIYQTLGIDFKVISENFSQPRSTS